MRQIWANAKIAETRTPTTIKGTSEPLRRPPRSGGFDDVLVAGRGAAVLAEVTAATWAGVVAVWAGVVAVWADAVAVSEDAVAVVWEDAVAVVWADAVAVGV